MGGDMFGVTPEDGVPPDPSPSNDGSGQTPPQPAPDKGEQPPQPPAREEPPAPPPAPPPEPPKHVGPPIDDEERSYLPAEGEDGFRLGNRVYKSLEAADHVFRRFGGRAHAAEQRATAAEERTRELEGLLVQYQTGTPTADAPPGAPADAPAAAPSPQRLTDLVKSEEFDELVAEHGPGKAYEKLAELAEQRMDQALEERMRPLQPLVNRSQGVDVATQMFDQMSEMRLDDGSRLYPELDPESPASDQVVGVWTELLEDPSFSEIALSPHGVRFAVQEYRLRQAQGSQPTPPPTPVVADRGAAIMGMGRNGNAPAPTRPGPTRIQMTPGQMEEAARQAVEASRDPVFGVTKER